MCFDVCALMCVLTYSPICALSDVYVILCSLIVCSPLIAQICVLLCACSNACAPYACSLLFALTYVCFHVGALK